METSPNFGVLEARLSNLEREHYRFGEAIASLGTRMDEKFIALSQQITQKNQTNWGVLGTFAGLLILVCSSLGGLAFLPVYKSLADHDVVIEKMRDSIVPRGEHSEKWASIYREADNLRNRITLGDEALQRQIDEIRKSVASIYGATDVIRDLNERLRKIEDISWRTSVETRR